MRLHIPRLGLTVIAALIGLLFFPRLAAAYLDPGTGSYMLQMLIATGLGLLFSVKIFWKKIRAFFRNTLGKKDQP